MFGTTFLQTLTSHCRVLAILSFIIHLNHLKKVATQTITSQRPQVVWVITDLLRLFLFGRPRRCFTTTRLVITTKIPPSLVAYGPLRTPSVACFGAIFAPIQNCKFIHYLRNSRMRATNVLVICATMMIRVPQRTILVISIAFLRTHMRHSKRHSCGHC